MSLHNKLYHSPFDRVNENRKLGLLENALSLRTSAHAGVAIPRIFKHLGRKTKLFPSNRGAATPVTSVTGSQRHTFLTAREEASLTSCLIQLVRFAEQHIADGKQDHQSAHGDAFVLQLLAENMDGGWLMTAIRVVPRKAAPLPQMSIRPKYSPLRSGGMILPR